MSVENPGSLISYAQKNGMDISKAAITYSIEVDEYRRALAENLGVTPEQLHLGEFTCQQADQAELSDSNS